jgi:hypothetical protein
MNEHEELLAKALIWLSGASKIENPVVRAKVLDLVYHSQQVAQAALLRAFDGARSNPEPSAEGVPLTSPTSPINPRARV